MSGLPRQSTVAEQVGGEGMKEEAGANGCRDGMSLYIWHGGINARSGTWRVSGEQSK